MKKSFTLIELLIVVIIVGILATVALPQYQKVVKKARWTEAVSMLGAIRKACEIYYQGHGVKPQKSVANDYIYLNGTAKEDEFASWIDIEIPEPRPLGNWRFIYSLYADNRPDEVGWVHVEESGDDEWTSGEDAFINIYYDGRLVSGPDAPEF
ncbi:MAG: prepilin-type N-terminal cleavage/methylation domain-containing protein [Candidatus Omnitrophica bacterium]|nr:prepilin-type N-terminal cleavage/methylation domain-containing protein [Candidatus Omnitrophota bacterium]